MVFGFGPIPWSYGPMILSTPDPLFFRIEGRGSPGAEDPADRPLRNAPKPATLTTLSRRATKGG